MLFLNENNTLQFKYDLNTWENYKFSFDVIPAFKFQQEFIRYKYFVLDVEIFKDCSYGLGDVLMYSSIPERIKKDPKGLYNKVYVRNYFKTKYSDWDPTILTTIFKDNPYIDGFIDYPFTGLFEGVTIPHNQSANRMFPDSSLTNLILYYLGIDVDFSKESLPILYFNTPKRPEYINLNVIDLHANSNERFYKESKMFDRVENYFNSRGFLPELQIIFKDPNIDSINSVHKFKNVERVEVSSLEEYIQIVDSCKTFWCLFSGSSLIATALRKKDFNIFFVEKQFQNKTLNLSYKKFRFNEFGKEIHV